MSSNYQHKPNYQNKSNPPKSPSCRTNAHNFAQSQGTFYDDKTNTMLYGLSSNLRVTGVSDGTCNQINPLMLRYNGRCGAGTAGANPCVADNNEYIEPFCDSKYGCNINQFISIVFLVLILFIIININIYDRKAGNV